MSLIKLPRFFNLIGILLRMLIMTNREISHMANHKTVDSFIFVYKNVHDMFSSNIYGNIYINLTTFSITVANGNKSMAIE